MQQESLEKLKQKLAAIDDAVTKDQLIKAISAVLEFSKKLETKTEQELQSINEAVKSAFNRLQSFIAEESKKTKKQLSEKTDELMNKMMLEHEAMMAECDAKMAAIKDGEDGIDGVDGQDADEEKIVTRILALLPKPKDPELTQKDKEELLQLIKDLQNRISNTRTAPFIGPSRGIFVNVNGGKKGLQNTLNFTGSVTYSVIDGMPTLSISGGTGATDIEDKLSGTVDGSNLIFTFTHSPKFVIVDGAARYVTTDYTLSGSGPYTVTLLEAAPVRTIRGIYST